MFHYWWNVIGVWILVNITPTVSINNAAFSSCGLLPKLWFANQMSQVCLRFGLHPAIISLDFAFANCPLLVLWLAVARQQPQLAAETQRHKANTTKTSKQASCGEEALWKALFATLSMWFNFSREWFWVVQGVQNTHTHTLAQTPRKAVHWSGSSCKAF